MNIFEEDIVTPIDLDQFEKFFDENIKTVVTAIRKYGFDLRVVGGAVRDFLINKPPRDVDFVTDADPAELILIFELESIEYDTKGIAHGTVKAVFGEEKIDVTSIAYKIDYDSDSMNIVKGKTWEVDAKNRDITINSLSLDLDGNIHDYVNGIEDLKNEVVRFNASSYAKINKQPDLILRWFKALTLFKNPKWLQKDYELIKQKLPLLTKIKDDSKTVKTLGLILTGTSGKKVFDLMCKLGVNKFIEINCK